MTTATLTDYRAHLTRRLEERGVPEHLHRWLLAYFTERKRPGLFLQAMLHNDFRGVVQFADADSYAALTAIAQFLVWCVPEDAWGSPEKVQAWLADRGQVEVPE